MTTKNRITVGPLSPEPATREGRMLTAGSLTVTLTSKKSGKHVTLRFRSKAKIAGAWQRTDFARATHVFVSDANGERLATFYPKDGVIRFADDASEAARWSIKATLKRLAGLFAGFDGLAELVAQDYCGWCSRPLTDPESIERGFGPQCYGLHTGSRHAATRAA